MIEHIQIYLDASSEDEVRIAHAEALEGDRPVHVTGLYANIMPSYAALADENGAAAILAYEALLRERGLVNQTRLRARLDRISTMAELRRIEAPLAQAAHRMASEARSGDILVATCPYRGALAEG